jgi:hypothetical protein
MVSRKAFAIPDMLHSGIDKPHSPKKKKSSNGSPSKNPTIYDLGWWVNGPEALVGDMGNLVNDA